MKARLLIRKTARKRFREIPSGIFSVTIAHKKGPIKANCLKLKESKENVKSSNAPNICESEDLDDDMVLSIVALTNDGFADALGSCILACPYHTCPNKD